MRWCGGQVHTMYMSQKKMRVQKCDATNSVSVPTDRQTDRQSAHVRWSNQDCHLAQKGMSEGGGNDPQQKKKPCCSHDDALLAWMYVTCTL